MENPSRIKSHRGFDTTIRKLFADSTKWAWSWDTDLSKGGGLSKNIMSSPGPAQGKPGGKPKENLAETCGKPKETWGKPKEHLRKT